MIYLVEDDESIRELVVYTLKSQGMDAKGFERPSLFWKELEKEVPALIREFDSCIIKIVRAGRIKPVLFLSSFSLYYLVIFSDM